MSTRSMTQSEALVASSGVLAAASGASSVALSAGSAAMCSALALATVDAGVTRPASDLAIERVQLPSTQYGFAGAHWAKRNGEGSGALS